MSSFSIAIHGGAGTIRQSEMSPDKELAYRAALASALEAGKIILENNGSAVDAVAASVTSLENCPLFNAGKGAVFTHQGRHELDASIMDGSTLKAGSVLAVQHIENPILLAKEIMLHAQHIMLVGEGAEEFARECGFLRVENSFFSTEFRRMQWDAIKDTTTTQLDHTLSPKDQKKGTVGAVAKDKFGNLAAATSTGGMTNKRFGRIGDTPIIGAGTYAKNGVCAVSATGWGEFFIRGVVAHDIACLVEYKGLSIAEAARKVIMEKLLQLSPIDNEYGDGGVICLDGAGEIAMVFNTEGMYRAEYSTQNGRNIHLYKT